MSLTFENLSPQQVEAATELLRPFVSEHRQARIEQILKARTRDMVLVLEDIYSDHNSSALLRTADAIGMLEFHIVAGKTPFRVAKKVTSGAHKWLELRLHQKITHAYAQLRKRGYQMWASDVHGGAVALESIPTDAPVALVFGNEHEGLSTPAIEEADRCFRVPMRGFVESLNISVAAAISMHDVYSRRKQAGALRALAPEDFARLRARWFAFSVRAAPQLLEREGFPKPESQFRPQFEDLKPGEDPFYWES